MNYIIKSTSTKKSQVIEKDFSLSGKDYRVLKTNTNTKPVSDFLKKSYTGKEIGSEAYMKNSKHRFLKTFNIGKNFCLEMSKFEYCKPINKVFPQKGDILIAKDGGGDGLGESVIYNLDNKSKKDSISAGILGITLDEKYKFYIFGFIKSKHFKNFVDLNTAQGSTIRHSKKVALDYKIPFPTLKNNINPQNLEKYISVIVQNIIDKEEKIKLKNKLIDEVIETELKENQKEISFNYSYPRIKEIQKEMRFDTGLYEKEYKRNEFMLKNYKGGIFTLNEKGYLISRGQNLQISSIGKSYYSEKKINDKFYNLILSSNISENSTVHSNSYLGNENNLKTIEKEEIIFCGRGAQFGRVTIFPEVIKNTITNIDNFHIKNKNDDIEEKIFISQILRYYRKIRHLYKIAIFGNGSYSFTKYHLEDLYFPNFPKKKQEEIAKLYYNKTDKNIDVNLENYLEKEIKRNELLGIFQLNMEIFELREKLENIIHKIVIEEKIEIDLKY